ncbi:MAG TPA: hypothetical protein VFQ42_21930 [Mycobacterium sp.]|nr:hypothetical protein [Mycobacterium sp.]
MDEKTATRAEFGVLALAGIIMLGAATWTALDDAKVRRHENAVQMLRRGHVHCAYGVDGGER